jgi:CrcB protein
LQSSNLVIFQFSLYLPFMKSIIFVALGGALGAVLRYLFSVLLKDYTQVQFPINTFLVNAIGCFCIGLCYALLMNASTPLSNPNHFDTIKLLLIVGILGGFTTYSSFAFETITMLKQQLFKQAFAYILLTNLVCIGFAYLGFSIKS